ncbi:nuclear transport factor 2 family protein [Oscillochloris sp. ZM17-4]|uniref:nuclear transport factor 2 family protein n=1 Tax=Oscillochloris sp. ZM17-4 TaxID=2866714 RepID=UPI001C72B6E6|nr:nuclear transport factor 2 family protein [Oscillochloris sp. ZM17-4]MBX0329093.1 nuclear transport factor 2 family protein [Oscillochloris sp. ZM17-4]
MKQTDRFLLAIISGVVVLVVAALALALTRTPQGYLPDTTPGGVAHNYILAIKQRDSARAYGYLSPDLRGYPPTVDDFVADIDSRYSWSFSRESSTISVGDERITGDRAAVTVSETRFSEGGLFSSGQYSTSFSMNLRRQGDSWQLISAESYWASCWGQSRPCE